MPLPVLTPELLRSAERFDIDFQLARMQAAQSEWDGFGIEIETFGEVTAIRAESPFLRTKNRLLNFTHADTRHLADIVAFFRGNPFSLTLPYDDWSPETFDQLAGHGLKSKGAGTVPATLPAPYAASQEITVHPSTLEDEKRYREIYRQAFATRGKDGEDELRFQWIRDSLPGARRFVAEIDGEPIGVASMVTLGEVSYLAACGVLPEWRGRGVQQALIHARVGAAHEANSTLVLGGGFLFSPPRRNFERCGFCLLPLGMTWFR